MANQIGIFAKYWTPGRVKTRLAAEVGDQVAAGVARLFIETLLDRLHATADRRVIGYSPSDRQAEFETAAGDHWQIVPQCEGNLGDRMEDYFQRAFAAGAERVVLLGADSPNLPLETIETAFASLESSRLVLAPTDDGGYCLVGARSEPPPIFDNMPWSEPNLWAATRERLNGLGWQEGDAWHSLPAWYDVDTVDDLQRLRSDLKDVVGDATLVRLAAELDYLVPESSDHPHA